MTDDAILGSALAKLAMSIVSDDGVANACIAEAAVRIGELSAIVSKLPRTADGVPIAPGDTAWFRESRYQPLCVLRVFRRIPENRIPHLCNAMLHLQIPLW